VAICGRRDKFCSGPYPISVLLVVFFTASDWYEACSSHH
jgi:hypothetical protein